MKEKFNRAKKSTYGQNFIYNQALLADLTAECKLQSTDTVLEIGAGAGTLTEVLAQTVKHVTSVEIDESLLPYLNVLQEKYTNLNIILADFMQWDFESVFANTKNLKVIANIPYYITTAIYHKLLFCNLDIAEISCMVQLEVAQKIVATPKQKNEYGTLALLCQHKYHTEIIQVIGKENFSPVPKVDSAFVRLVKKENFIENTTFDNFYYKLVKAAFLHRRKTLLNSLKSSGYNIDEVSLALQNIADIQARAENLSYTQYIALAKALIKH